MPVTEIKVKINDLQLSVTTETTVAQLKKLVHENDPTIETQDLLYQQVPLDDNKTLGDYDITADTTLVSFKKTVAASPNTSLNAGQNDVTSTSTTTTTTTTTTTIIKKKSKKRCSFKNCISAPLRGVGDCSLCDGHFCSKHRLLEQHNCDGLQTCKQQMHQRNAVKLQEQQTVASKV